MITLSAGQQKVFEQIMKWFATDEQIFVLGGYAGSGKTTLAQYIAYAITCHKAQGSEFDTILIYNELIGQGEQHARWLYTAISLAKKYCVLVDPK